MNKCVFTLHVVIFHWPDMFAFDFVTGDRYFHINIGPYQVVVSR